MRQEPNESTTETRSGSLSGAPPVSVRRASFWDVPLPSPSITVQLDQVEQQLDLLSPQNAAHAAEPTEKESSRPTMVRAKEPESLEVATHNQAWDRVVDQDPVLAQISALRHVIKQLKTDVMLDAANSSASPSPSIVSQIAQQQRSTAEQAQRAGDSISPSTVPASRVAEQATLQSLDLIRQQVEQLQGELHSKSDSLRQPVYESIAPQNPGQETNRVEAPAATTLSTRAGLERLRGQRTTTSVVAQATSAISDSPSPAKIATEQAALHSEPTMSADAAVGLPAGSSWYSDRNAWLNVSWYAAAAAVIVALTLLSHQWIFGDSSRGTANRSGTLENGVSNEQVADPNRAPSARITGVLPEIVPTASGSRVADRNVVEMNYEEPIDWENEGVLAPSSLDQLSTPERLPSNPSRSE